MESNALLTVDGNPIFSGQALAYLQASGKLQAFMTEILRQYVIAHEFQTRNDLEIDPLRVEQAGVDFRFHNNLTDPKVFEDWLKQNSPVYANLRGQTIYRLKLEKLKSLVAAPKLQEYFIERKIFLDQVVLSQIAVGDLELAEELRSQIIEGSATFEQLAREHSIAEDRIVNGMMGPMSRGRLSNALRAAIELASPEEIVGPVKIGERYCLFRIEQFLPASLEGKLKEQLQDEIFERWLAEKIQKMTVKLQGN